MTDQDTFTLSLGPDTLVLTTLCASHASYDEHVGEVRVSLQLKSADGERNAQSWDEMRAMLRSRPEVVERAVKEGLISDLLVMVITVANLDRPLTDSPLFSFLDPLLAVPRDDLLPSYQLGKLTWHSYALRDGVRVITRHIWDVPAGSYSHSDLVNVVAT